MYGPRKKVWWFAITSRIIIIFLQFIFNSICPDHDADAFSSPRNPREKHSIFDNAITFLFGGLTRWDAQYFIHIAKYGFTYENTLAFFPLYPMAIRCTAMLLRAILFVLNDHSIIILTAVVINFICFIKSAVILFDLSLHVLKDVSLAYKATILYCLNPASIFFTAAYSESLFALLTFRTMLASVENNYYVFLPLSLSTLVRSNGLTNLGFPAYNWMKSIMNTAIPNFISEYKSKWSSIFDLRHICLSICQIGTIIILSILPFGLLQIYNYSKFCIPRANTTDLPPYIVHYAIENDLVLPGNFRSPWCDSAIPLAYSYVQEKYWNVGFLKYYQLKQIPQFLLAFPILYIMLKFNIKFLREHKSEILGLSIFGTKEEKEKTVKSLYPLEMFPFVVHSLFLTCFCIFIVHIQISTRLLVSASPVIFWYCAFALSYKTKFAEFEESCNLDSKWKVFLLTQKTYSKPDILILGYFLSYIIVGTFMYSNFLPWT
ncbi:GPI mannosyltransferase 2 isoform X2 [Leptopilina heterotoma]|uniref:GPI mannosyltransferase 2 isoform X2 n=1 Tax=Leptopilina heterotoma TaxID=63436 RepID=UPI001CA861E6|nr:GPI mannosyltransferase 2 isoform X2 [Leptopilina heterotoma]